MPSQSCIAWVDFSEEDRRKMIEVVSLFRLRDTRDELGLGSIRDALAELFFPGTNTLETRARYLLFVPWLYRSYEQCRVPSAQIATRLRSDEVRLIYALQAGGESAGAGIIGRVSGASLHRFPSSIYWASLHRWGILRYPGSPDQYQRSLDRFYLQHADGQRADDNEPVAGRGGSNWDPRLPPAAEHFLERTSFTLTASEAAYLRERVTLSCPDSLLCTILNRCAPVDWTVKFIWQHAQLAHFPGEQRSWIEHAQNFSETMHGAMLLYNLMLAEQSQQSELTESYRSALADWARTLATRGASLCAWDRHAFWQLARRGGHIPSLTEQFVNAWLDIVLNDTSVPKLAEHARARELVREREIWLKQGRSRLKNQKHLDLWTGASGTGQLDYRWGIARRITNDILVALAEPGRSGGEHAFY